LALVGWVLVGERVDAGRRVNVRGVLGTAES
jgi:hypothetical protein